jgi:hypothetical protein
MYQMKYDVFPLSIPDSAFATRKKLLLQKTVKIVATRIYIWLYMGDEI